MDAPIIASIITGTATVSGAIATFLIKHWETRKLQAISAERRNAVVGTWVGESQQDLGPDGKPEMAQLKFVFATKGKKVIGTGEHSGVLAGTPYAMHLRIVGGFLHSKFLRLEYDPRDASKLQFGSVLLELGNNADQITGRYLGFGPYTNGMVWGTISLKKAST